MLLKETAVIMCDGDYKKRFVAEYWQLKNRVDGLHKMLVKYSVGKLEFVPSCPYELLNDQYLAMGEYLNTLEQRAVIEDIELYRFDNSFFASVPPNN